MKALLRIALLVALTVAVALSAGAQEKSWVGELVQYTKPSASIRFGDRVGDKRVDFPFSGIMPIKVRAERDGQMRIHDGIREGWVDKADFVLVRDAAAYFERRVRANPKDAFALYMRGVGLFQKGELDNAISDFNRCLRLQPHQFPVLNSRGNAWSAKKDYDKAIADYSEVIRLHPEYALAYRNRGLAWHEKKDYESAIADFNQAIRIDPKYTPVFGSRANSWSAKKNYEKAVADYSEVIRLDPTCADAYCSRGLAWQEQKKFGKAIADYSEAVRIDPNFVDAYNSRAWIWATCPDAKFRDGKKALESARHALELDPKDAANMDTLAAAYAETGDFAEAVRWQEKAMEDPQLKNDANARHRLELYRDKKPYRQE